jgi:phenylacetate-CoA ligase
MELSVIVPCLDEQANVPELVRRVAGVLASDELQRCGGGELILVDDGSTDDTLAVARAQAGVHDFVRVVHHADNRGIVAAWRSGCTQARGRRICVLDADLQYQPEDILSLWRALETGGADIIQGIRRWTEGRLGSRYLISRGFNLLVNAAFGMREPDNKSGFLMCGREVFDDLLRHDAGYRYWQLFVMVAAARKGYACRRVETPFHPRRRGRSFLADVPVGVMGHALVDVARALAEYRFRSRGA